MRTSAAFPDHGPRSQRVLLADGRVTYTVIGTDFLPIRPAEEYLRFLLDDSASPNTIRSYAAGLAAWFAWLAVAGEEWDDFPAGAFGGFLSWLRTGSLPGQLRIGPPSGQGCAPATVKVRSAAVLAFYRWQAAANGLVGPHQTLYSPLVKRGRRPYVSMLAGVADRGGSEHRPLFSVRSGPKRRTPVLTPDQVQAILDGCAIQRPDGSWTGSPAALRNRLLFALLAETGMRVGEALALRHCDIRMGRGQTPAVDVSPRNDHPHGARVKSGQPRRVYVSDDLEALYAAYVWSLVDAQMDLLIGDISSHFVFVNVAGGNLFSPMRTESVYATVRSLRARQASVLPAEWTPHWLRHTHATALLLSGCPPHVVMRRLGHLDVQTTLSVYGWVTEDAELRAVANWREYAEGWRKELLS